MEKSERQTDTLFTWVHLSDIHIGHGDVSYGLDQKLVLAKLKDDVAACPSEYDSPIPKPDAIFVTGDLAFSGAVLDKKEYTGVRDLLLGIAQSLRIDKQKIFIVPGNHDVQRNVAKGNKNVARLLDALRSGREKIDAALANKNDRKLLARRMQNYYKFAKEFGLPDAQVEPLEAPELFWKNEFQVGTLKIRIAGFNTALLSADDDDKGKLELGGSQLNMAIIPIPDPSSVAVIALSHHPFDWLRDGTYASEWMNNNSHLHLCGHIHEASSESFRSGGGMKFNRVVSGAAHGDPSADHISTGHGYNFGSLLARYDGQLLLRVWPRVWSQKNTDFRKDVDNTPKKQQFAEHELRFKLAKRPTQKTMETGGSQGAGAAVNGKPKGKMVLIYVDKNYKFLKKTVLTDFLKSLATEEELEFSWDRNELSNAEIKSRLNDADIVVCLVSEPFLNSSYMKDVQAKIEAGRLKKQDIIVMPVLLEKSTWEKHSWIKDNGPLPEDGYIIPNYNTDRAKIFKAIWDQIRARIRDRRHAIVSAAPAATSHKPRALYTLRRLPDSSFTPEEMESLVADSKMRAEKFVPAQKLRKQICRAAQTLIKKNKGQPLSTEQLEDLDEEFLLPSERRNKDAKKIRWVLRANRLHPQGVVKQGKRA